MYTAGASAPDSQSVKAQLRLREMILAGELPGGSRIAELRSSSAWASRARRSARRCMRLEQEGLLEALPNGGYAVRTFSERDVADAIELRGTLEGLAARLAASAAWPKACWPKRGSASTRWTSCSLRPPWTTRPSPATWA
jgi:GntR family transcriptional regulator of vanillate catabolism